MTRSLLLLGACFCLFACYASHGVVGEDAGAGRRDAAQDASPGDTNSRPDVLDAVDAWAPDVFDAGVTECPPGIDPYADPYLECAPDGIFCNESVVCGGAMFCECVSGLWRCAVAHPDPVCTCGREPAAGDPCASEGASCGECCPTLGGPGWSPMTCVGGTWQPADCPEVECPRLGPTCPADSPAALGASCDSDGLICGNPCCGTATRCSAGMWEPGPQAGCACLEQQPCGEGACREDQVCAQGCGPDDGPVYTCEGLPEGCNDCACMPRASGFGSCEMVDGMPRLFQECG